MVGPGVRERKQSKETNPTGILISDLQPPDLYKNKHLLKEPSLWSFAGEALAPIYYAPVLVLFQHQTE